MKTITLVRMIVAAVLAGSAVLLQAQNPAPACPLGHAPGYGRTLTPEQRTVQRAEMQKLVAELRGKLANGTITAEEKAWLQQVEQRGGPCVGGEPRGRGQGPRDGTGNQWRRGQGQGKGQGQGRGACQGQGCRQGAMLGTEVSSQMLAAQCPGNGNGQGQGQGQGPKDGTGKQKGKGKGKGTGTCPS